MQVKTQFGRWHQSRLQSSWEKSSGEPWNKVSSHWFSWRTIKSVSNWCIHGSTRSEQAPYSSNSQFLAIRTLRRMFLYTEFPRALGRSKALVTRMKLELKDTQNYENRSNSRHWNFKPDTSSEQHLKQWGSLVSKHGQNQVRFHLLARGPFLESPENVSGPKSHLWTCQLLVQDSWFLNMFQGNKKQNDSEVWRLKSSPFLRYRKNCDTRK